MQIRTQIFSWVFFATIVPLTTVALIATYYLQRDYQQGVEQSIQASLENLATELKRRLEGQQELALGLSRASAVQDFIPLLKQAETGRVPPIFNTYRTRVNHYFEGFQTILSGMYIMRLMDRFGNVYVKVSHNKRSAPVYESLSGMMFVEPEVNDTAFLKKLEKLVPNEVNMSVLKHNEQQSELMATLPLLDYVIPLYDNNELVGALSLTLFGEQIDSILNHASRLYDASLFLVENNPDDPARHGLVLFDDDKQINVSQIRNVPIMSRELYGEALLENIGDQPSGRVESSNKDISVYFQELFPYPTQLTSWIVGVRVPDAVLVEPFEQIRWVIWSIAGFALVISLLLSNFGVRLIASPLRELSKNLLSYARGERAQRVQTNARIDEIRDMELAFNSMADSLDRASEERDEAQHMMLQSAKLASIGQMAAGIGHEINNPLNNILSYAKLLERSIGGADERLREDVQSLKQEAIRASDIIRGILNFARQVPPQYATFKLAKWLQDTINLVQQTAKTAGIALAYECNEDIEIEGDRGQLQQALINLLINAIQASEEHSEVRIVATSNANDAIISVIDTGSGISEDNIDNVFDPFYTTKPEGKGSGLGLSVSLGIVERHNGKLTMKNNPNRGVTATLIVPLKRHQKKAS